MTTTRIHLIRHGQVEGYDQPRYNGQSDVKLTDLGISQYQLLRERFSTYDISACYTSDLSRCVVGAEIISEQFEIQPIRRSQLRELDIGLWEGLIWEEILRRWPEEWQARLADLPRYRPLGGENLLDLEARVMPVIDEILNKNCGREILVVAHGGVNRIILLNVIGAPLEKMFNIEQNYGCHNIIDFHTDGAATVKLLNGLPA